MKHFLKPFLIACVISTVLVAVTLIIGWPASSDGKTGAGTTALDCGKGDDYPVDCDAEQVIKLWREGDGATTAPTAWTKLLQ